MNDQPEHDPETIRKAVMLWLWWRIEKAQRDEDD
jgi:hypothetical protein